MKPIKVKTVFCQATLRIIGHINLLWFCIYSTCAYMCILYTSRGHYTCLLSTDTNPQYRLEVRAPHKATVWILLSRHITEKVSDVSCYETTDCVV